MSRHPRGTRRYDRIEDREEIKAICLETRERLGEITARVAFSAPHYHPTVNVTIALLRIAEMLGHPEYVPHSIGCEHPPRDD